MLEGKLESFDMLGLDVMLLSHYPVSTYIQKQVSYFVYDNSNPLLILEHGPRHIHSRAVVSSTIVDYGEDWEDHRYPARRIRMKSFLPDAGWAVFNKMMKAADLGLPLDYDYYTIINYDVDLQPSFVKEMINLDFDGDMLLSWSMQEGEDYKEVCKENKPMLGMGKGPGLLFSILKKEAFSEIRRTISREEYLKKDEENALKYEFAEQYWGFVTKPFDVYFTEEVSVSMVDTLKDDCLAYGQIASVENDTEEESNSFKIFFEGRRLEPGSDPTKPETKESIRVFIFHIEGTQRFKINGEKIIELTSDHLEENVKSISYLKPDGPDYSFDKERERATELFNRIELDSHGK